LGSRAPASAPAPAGHPGPEGRQTLPLISLDRLDFQVPDRSGMPALDSYAYLTLPDGSRRVVGYTEASRGCKHLCRHCPIVPVYNGRFRVVQREVVLEDIGQQVAFGAEHITFGDPDFFNGVKHALELIRSFDADYAPLTYDVSITAEPRLRYAERLPTLHETGCAFVTTAVESVDDQILQILEKGHTRADFVKVVDLCRQSRINLVPTFVAF